MVLLSALLAIAPSHAASFQVVGSLLQEASLTAGQTTEGSVVLRNDGDSPLEVMVYPRDASDEGVGPAVVGSNRPWLRFTPRLVTVRAGGTAEVPYRVEVPADAQVSGSFGTLLVIEPTRAPIWPPPAEPPPVVEGYRVSIVTHVGP